MFSPVRWKSASDSNQGFTGPTGGMVGRTYVSRASKFSLSMHPGSKMPDAKNNSTKPQSKISERRSRLPLVSNKRAQLEIHPSIHLEVEVAARSPGLSCSRQCSLRCRVIPHRPLHPTGGPLDWDGEIVNNIDQTQNEDLKNAIDWLNKNIHRHSI